MTIEDKLRELPEGILTEEEIMDFDNCKFYLDLVIQFKELVELVFNGHVTMWHACTYVIF